MPQEHVTSILSRLKQVLAREAKPQASTEFPERHLNGRPMVPGKLLAFDGESWSPWAKQNTYEQVPTKGPDRLVIACSGSSIDLLLKLLGELPEPFGLLYVLLVSRVGRSPGRYQAPEPWTRAEVTTFLNEFRPYLERDARHHVWITSLPAHATLVYDNHDVIHA